jgi:Domain of unknown function (DUF4214)
MIAGEIELRLFADLARIKRDMDDARRIVGDTMTSLSGMAGIATKALGAVGLALSAKEFAGMIKGSIDAAAGLHDLSIQTGASVASLMAFRSVASTSDTTIEGIGAAMNKMAKGMAVANEESKGMGQAIQAIGLDFNKLKAMAPDQQMLSVAKALDHFQDGAGKSAVAMTLFGKEGAKMLPFLKDLADESDSVTAKLTEQQVRQKDVQAAMADDFGDNLVKIKKASEQWKKDLAMGMLPALTDASEEFLKAASSANGLNSAIKKLAEDGSIERWTRGAIDGVKALGAAIVPAAKIWAGYYTAFVVAPAIFSTVATAIGTLQVQIALAKMEMAAGTPIATLFGASVGGIAAPAEWAAGALGKLKVAAGALFAAFAGWEIGSYLRDNFVEARIAGLAFVGATLTGWENVKYGAQMAWEGIKFAWDKTVGGMKKSFADYLTAVSKGLSFVGATDTAKQVEAYAEGLRKAAASTGTFKDRTAGLTAAHKAALAAIDQNIVDLVSYELAANNAANGADGAAKSIKKVLDFDANADTAAKKEAEAYATLISAIRSKIDENKLELAVGENVTEGQKLQIKMDQELASGKLKLSAAHIASAQAALTELGATEESLKLQAAQRDVTKYIAESTRAREDSSAALDIEYAMYGKTADARAMALVALDAEKWKETELAKLREAKEPITTQIISQLNAEAKARTLVGEATLGQGKALQYAAQLKDENKRFGLEYIMDEKARAAATLAIDDDMWQERIRNAGEGTEAQKRLQQEYSTWYQNQLAKPELERQKKMWESVEQTAHDTFISIFDSGKSAFDRLRDALKNGLLDLLYQMTLRPWIIQIGASMGFGGATGLAQAGTMLGQGGGNLFSAVNTASNLYKLASNGLSGIGASAASGAGSLLQGAGSLFGSSSLASYGAGMSAAAAGSGEAAMYASAMSSGNLASGAIAGNTMGAGLGAAASIGAGVMGGVFGGRAISGGYGSNGAVNTGTAIGAAVGSIVPVIGTALGALVGGLLGGAYNRLFGHKAPEVQSQGIRGSYSGGAASGESYQNILEKGGWFASDKKYQETQAFTDEMVKRFGEGFSAIKTASAGFAASIGVSTTSLDHYAKAFDITLTKDAAANEKAITDFFTGVGDEVANSLVPNLKDFSKYGESAAATLQRLAGDFQATDQMAQLIGKSAKDAFGSVGIESAKARERLIELAGGTQALGQQAGFYAQNFLTEAERLAPVQKALDAAMASLGLSSVQTREQFKNVINGLDLTTEAGAQQYTAMMKLAEAFAQVHPAIDATVDKLQKLKDDASTLLGGVDSAFSVLQKVVEREKAALQTRIDAEAEVVNKLKSLSGTLHSTLDSMRLPDQAAQSRAAAQAQIKTALAIAKAGGPLPTEEKSLEALKKSLGIVSQDASSQFASYIDYQRDFYTTQGDIAALADLTDDALSVEERSLKAMQDQVKALDAMLAHEQEQIDILKGIDTTGLSIVQAIEALHGAILSAMKNPLVAGGSAINQAYQSALGRPPDSSGLDFWQHQLANGVPIGDIVGAINNSPEAQVKALYQSLLGRPADAGGLDFFLHSGASMDAIKDAIENSAEYQALHPFAVGINRVPTDMPALIHKDEAIVPAALNPFNPNARANGLGGNTDRLEQLIDRLTATVERQQQALDQIQRNTRRQADTLDVVTEGGSAMRTA